MLTSTPFLLDLLLFTDALFFFLLDFREVCTAEKLHQRVRTVYSECILLFMQNVRSLI